jgi:hypothetical protein
MNAPTSPADDLIFGWEKPGRGKLTLGGFLLVSLALHAFGFYLFQIVYPPAVALLPPPGRVSLIAPDSDEGRQLLRWVEAEDPALASTTQAPPDSRALVMPTIQHAPSYLGRQPALKDLPPGPSPLSIPSARPPAAVERPSTPPTPVVTSVPTIVSFSAEFDSLRAPQMPQPMFVAGGRDTPGAARFAVAVNEKGEVRYCFLQTSSGDPALDEQARKYLAATRFPAVPSSPPPPQARLTWGSATLEWGNDVTPAPPPSSTSPTP